MTILLAGSLIACGDSQSTEERSLINPDLGISEVMTVTEVREWELTQFRDEPGKFVILGQNGRPVVSVVGGGPRRSIHVEGSRVGANQVTIEVADDHSIAEISFFSAGILYKLQKGEDEWILNQHRRSSEP